MGNRLKGQSSPYLRQHAENPVNWYPWCDEAFERAEKEDKPVFLSVGYSTCHWCHVMAHESFENQEIADILNQNFISVKVDREERPDIDSVYMSVCQAFTGSGGWPMSIFMTPAQKPFFAGTYFPPESGPYGTGFMELLTMIAGKWRSDKESLLNSADQIVASLNSGKKSGKPENGGSLPERGASLFEQSFDKEYGGFGAAPKFPSPHNLIFLMLYAKLYKDNRAQRQVYTTLEQMRRGGIFDHIGFGFARYSTDRYFLVPHFEKMLYDNALLILAYCTGYKLYNDPDLLDTAEKTGEYILREMTGGEGEFYSAQDADSDGEEGKYYVWQYDEICRVPGMERGMEFCNYFGITPRGNFEGKNIPNLLNGNKITDEFEQERQVLYKYRLQREKLHLDDKVLTAWNGLMICGMCCLYRVTGKEHYLVAAKSAQTYIEKYLTEGDCLYAGCRERQRSVRGFLDDYAYETAALLGLYEVTGDGTYLKRAGQFCKEAIRQFASEDGGYYMYGCKNDRLISRPKETYDGAMPGGNSMMAYCLVQLARLTQDQQFRQAAQQQLAFMSGEAQHYPAGYCMFLTALLLSENEPPQITVVPEEGDEPGKILSRLPLYADIRILEKAEGSYQLLNQKTTYYVCKDHRCLPPANQAEVSQ